MKGIRHEKHNSLIDELPFFLQINLERTPYICFPEQNWHENVEIQLCTSGKGTVILDGRQYVLEKGDIAVVNSNVIHYTGTDEYLTYTCLIVSTEWCRQMGFDYNSLKFCECFKSDVLKKKIENLCDIFLERSDPLRIAKSNEILLGIFIELTEKHLDFGKKTTLKDKNFDTIKSTVAYIRENYNRKITLDEIAKSVFCDKYSLCKEFKKYTGQTVFESLNHYRIQRAADYLSEGYRVSETALLCGFENVSFFTKTFKKYMGKTPMAYKKTM